MGRGPALITHTYEVSIVGDSGAGSKRDITDGDDTDDRAYTGAEGQEDDGDHTLSPSQSSEHSYLCVCMFMYVNGRVMWAVSMSVLL